LWGAASYSAVKLLWIENLNGVSRNEAANLLKPEGKPAHGKPDYPIWKTPLRGNGTVKNSTEYPIMKTITLFALARQALFAGIQKKSHYFLIFCIKTATRPRIFRLNLTPKNFEQEKSIGRYTTARNCTPLNLWFELAPGSAPRRLILPVFLYFSTFFLA
jgi:hypothetical protein